MQNQARVPFRDTNIAKANFDRIYVQKDPREYYRVLYGLDYVIPDLARSVFRNIARALEALRGHPIKVLDLGCSYGINAALLRHPLSIDRLASRYREMELAGVTDDEITALDTNYFRSWPRDRITIVGLDSSPQAVEYARKVGLIDEGIVCDLEREELSPEDARLLEGVDLIISTGSIGYIGERTFGKVLSAIGKSRPWIASFVLRMFDYNQLDRVFSQSGLVSEKLKGVTFVQRRFYSEAECLNVLETLQDRGISTLYKEDSGLLHAEFFLARPEAELQVLDLEQVASVTSGEGRTFGRRFQSRSDQTLRFGK